ncbi:leukotriene B4 receptor 1 [Silurus meridionalis]|uniref:leukotriene B4 receptor 1 n=1 Tax=Silurus meridionalis TaxID=175797 RepID=UPI001EEBB445|nr:leukotriene B4 receptor 1 [Silurus meridionalis]
MHSGLFAGNMNVTAVRVLEQPQETGMETVFVGACIIMAVCFVVGTPGNLLVIWTIVKHVKQCSHTVLLIKHLAVADLLVVFTLPLWIYSLAWSWVFSEVMCKAMVYIIYACMYASIFLITIMSVERFLAVRFPFTSVTWRKKQMLNKILLVVWVASFLLSIPVIITQTLDEHNGQMQCLFREYESNTQEAVLLLLETLVGFVIPFFILVLCYGCLYSRITEMSFRSKRKSTLLIASVVVVFALCWIPHHITNLLSLVQLVEVRENIKDVIDAMYMISSSLVFVSSTINPVLYVFAARSFRTSLRDTGIHKLFRHLSSTATGEGNRELSFVSKRQSSQTNTSQCCMESKAQIDLLVDICNNAASDENV